MNKFMELIVSKQWVYNLEDYMIKEIDENLQIEALANKLTPIFNNDQQK